MMMIPQLQWNYGDVLLYGSFLRVLLFYNSLMIFMLSTWCCRFLIVDKHTLWIVLIAVVITALALGYSAEYAPQSGHDLLTQVRSMCSWTLPCVSSLVPSISHGFQCSPTLNRQPYGGRLPLTSWWRKSSNMTVGQPASVALSVESRYALPGYGDRRVRVRGPGWPNHCVRL